MDDLFWAFILVLIVACFWAAVNFALLVFLACAAVVTLILLPHVVRGFVRELRAQRERKAGDSNPEGDTSRPPR